MFREPEPKQLPLPSLSDGEDRHFAFWRPTEAFVDELAQALRGQRVLEIFAGNGLLAGLLAARGVDVLATSLLTDMDGHRHGVYHPVERLDAAAAAAIHRDSRDVLLMCWPTVTSAAVAACDIWGAGRPIVYMGECTDYAKNHLGGCATDEFFERFEVARSFASYDPRNPLDHARMGFIAPPLPKPSRAASF